VKDRSHIVSRRAASIEASKTRRMFALAERLPDVLNLAVGQPDFATPAHVVAEAKAAMDRGDTRYTHSLGITELRGAIAEKVVSANLIPAGHDWIAVTVGAMEGLILSMLATLDPGDEVLVPDPGYTNFIGQVRLASGRAISYNVDPPDFRIDVADLRRAVSERTRAILLCSPSNPTGGVLRRGNLEEIAEVAREHDLLVYSDETYEALVYDGVEHVSIGSLPNMAERTVSVFSFSKAYAMTGWRVGYVVAPPPLVERMNVLQEHLVSCASSISQHAALAALTGPQDCVTEMRAAYDERRRFLVEALKAIPGFTCPKPAGAFYAFPDVRCLGGGSDAIADRLLHEARVATVPGTAFNSRGEGFLRIGYAASMDLLEESVGRIAALVGVTA